MAQNEIVEVMYSGVDTLVTTGIDGANTLMQESLLTTDRVYSESMRMVELIIPYIITFLSAIVIYIVGKFIAGLIKRIATKVLRKIGFDTLVAKSGINKLKDAAGIQSSMSDIIANIIYYIIYISVIIAVLEKLGFTVVTDAMTGLISYIPNIIIALIVLIIGTMVSNFIKEVIVRVADTGGLSYSKALGAVGYSLSMIFISLIAIGQLQIDISIITTNLTLFIATSCFIIAVSGVFATKNIATNILATTYLKKHLSLGDTIEMDSLEGKIVDISSTNIVIETKKGKTYIPSDNVLSNIYTIK